MARSRQPDAVDAAEVGEDSALDSIVDRSTLDPNMHYRFIHSRPQRVARMRAKGYRPVIVSGEEGVKPIMEDSVSADGLIKSGDTILMFVPKERHLAGRKKLRTLNRSRMTAPKQQFRTKARGAAPDGTDVRIVETDKTDREG